jgi:hypothetical protein
MSKSESREEELRRQRNSEAEKSLMRRAGPLLKIRAMRWRDRKKAKVLTQITNYIGYANYSEGAIYSLLKGDEIAVRDIRKACKELKKNHTAPDAFVWPLTGEIITYREYQDRLNKLQVDK